jgi:hypothetical protein
LVLLCFMVAGGYVTVETLEGDHDDPQKTADGKIEPENKPDYLAFSGKFFLHLYLEHEHLYGREAEVLECGSPGEIRTLVSGSRARHP